MATAVSPSSSSLHDHGRTPAATLALPSASIEASAAASTSRRLPPPCWSPDETLVLIDAYKEKWYSLNRGNLRANHWQEVADDVASRFHAVPTKTAVQCRHKMEKLRKRYRTEIQRSVAIAGVRRSSSSWAHFQSMHSLERGSNHPSPPSSDDEDLDDDSSVKRIPGLYNKNQIFSNQGLAGIGATSGFRIKVPGIVTARPALPKVNGKFNEIGCGNHNKPNPKFVNYSASGHDIGSDELISDGVFGRTEFGRRASEISYSKKGNASMSEVVEAIEALGDGFMRIEREKMDMMRQLEEMRMEMELKRTKMILESHQRIVETYSKAISGRPSKKAKNSSA